MSRGGGGGLSKPGAVRITLHSNNNDIGEKAEVTVAVKNPENAVERMLHTLAQRFPPESVVTIQPAAGDVTSGANSGTSSSSSGSGVPTSTEGSRSSSFSGELSGGPTLALSPALRRGMATLSPELSGWVLANNPVIFPGLLELVTRGGDPKEFAARMGLSPEPVETVVQQLAQDADFFEWMTQLASAAGYPKSSKSRVRRAHTQPVRPQLGYPGALPSPAVGMILKDPNFPKQGYWLVDSDGMVVGHSDVDGNHVIHPVGPLGRPAATLYPYSPNGRPPVVGGASIPRDLTAVPRDPLHPEEGRWLVNADGKVVGHTNSIGRVVMHPVTDLSARPSQPSGFAGLNVVPRDPAHAEDGGPWLVDSTARVVGHYDQKGRPVMHPVVVSDVKGALPSPVPGLSSVAINPRKPEDGSWLLDRTQKIVGHTDSSNCAIMHPQNRLPLTDIKSSGVPELHMVPRDPKHPENGGPWLVDKHGNVIGHYDRERRPVMHPADGVNLVSQSHISSSPASRLLTAPVHSSTPIDPSRPEAGMWLRDPSGRIIGHADGSGKQYLHPQAPLSMSHSRPSGLPGVSVVARDPARPHLGGPWLVDVQGNIVGHYDNEGRVVLHPSLQPPPSPVPGLTMRPITPSRPLEGSWLLNAEGKIVGHTDPSNNPIFHPARPLHSANGRPSGLPGISVVPREASRPEDGGPWLVDINGNVVGHYDPEGRAVLQPSGLASTFDIESELPFIPMDPNNPRGPAWVLDSTTGFVVGHVEQFNASPVHHVVNTITHTSRPSGVAGINFIDGAVTFLADDRGQLIGHLSPEGRARFHPLLPVVPLTNLQRNGQLPMDPANPTKGSWIFDAQQTVVGHRTGDHTVMHPTHKFALDVTRPTTIPGLRRVSDEPVSWACDDDGNVIGHFRNDDAAFVLHPRSPRMSATEFAASPVLTEMPKQPEGSWLLSRDGVLVGHTDAKDQPVMHPQRPFPRSAMVTIGIAGIFLVSRDPQHPELGGPWLVGDDGYVLGHFEPEGRPLLHPNFKSRLNQPVPSPVAGYTAVYIDPERPTDGVWLIDPDGNVVGHAGLDGSAQMHPTGPLVGNVQSSLRGLSIAQRDPLNAQVGGPWVLDFNNMPVAHYSPEGRLVLHPPPKGKWDPISPPQSVLSQHQPSRGASSTGKYSIRTASGEQIQYDENGMRIRYVEVPVVEERVKEVIKKEVREIEKRVPQIDYQVREKIVEVPEIHYVERKVSKEIVEEVIRHVPKKEIIEVPKEVIVHVPKPETRIVEKIVEKPEVIEVPKPYRVEQPVNVPRYINQEKPTIVAQKLRPLIRESNKKEIVQAKTYEPMLYAVDVYIPKPVQSAFKSLGKVDETHSMVEIPAPQYNSLLKAMNTNKPEEALTDLYARGPGGIVPFLPVGELAEIVPPLHDAKFVGQQPPVFHETKRGAASCRHASPAERRGGRRRGRSHHRRRSASAHRRHRR